MAKRVESPSSINTFKQCSRKYYYHYIAKLPTIPNVHQVRGNIVHSTLENFYDVDVTHFTDENYASNIRGVIQRLFLHYWNTYQKELFGLQLNKDQERFYFEETMLMLLNWANHCIEELQQTMLRRNIHFQQAFAELTPLREQEFRSEKHSVHGFVDAIRYVEEEIQIIDYKTNAGSELKEEIRLQLAIYSLLYSETYGRLPTKVGAFFLRHKIKWMNVDEELLNLARREIQMIHAHTSNGSNIADYPKQIGPLCKWSTGKCDFYDVCRPFDKEEV